jgi:hypothetical protein
MGDFSISGYCCADLAEAYVVLVGAQLHARAIFGGAVEDSSLFLIYDAVYVCTLCIVPRVTAAVIEAGAGGLST